MEKWFVQLNAADDEVEQWKVHFPTHGDPRVTYFDVPDGQGGSKAVAGVASGKFNNMAEASEVDAISRPLVDEMKGWILCRVGWSEETEQVTTGPVYCLGEGGNYRGHHFIQGSGITASIRVSAVGVICDASGKTKHEPPSPTAGQIVIENGSTNTKAALRYFGRAKNGDWNSLYQAFDALGGTKGIKAKGVTHKEAVGLAQTFSQHRKHAVLPLNGRPMSFLEARALLARVIQRS